MLVSAPTGSGKTLVAEYAIDLALKAGRRCIYTSPIKALSNQKYRDFKDDPSIDVGIMTGDVTIRPEARLLIMTTEILRNTIFEDATRLNDVEYAIFDEIHYMDDFERGTVWEESIIFAPPSVRLVGLSATIANLEQFGSWIRSIRPQELEIVESTQRPVPLRHYLYFAGLDPFPPRDIQRVRRKVPRKMMRSRRRDSKGLLDELSQRNLMPTLFFCFSRKECEGKARGNAQRNLLTPAEREKMEDLFIDSCDAFELADDSDLERLRHLALRGIGFHHAGMLPLHKELVERLFTSGLLKLLFTTETFAMGINMPARTVVFDSLRKFDGVSFDFLRTRDYLQMAGRAGRLGKDKEGLVYSVLDASDVMSAPVERIIFGQVEPIRSKFNLSYSTLIHLYSRLGERLYEAWEKSFNFFQAQEQNRVEKNRKKQLSLIQAKLSLLREIGYIDESGILDRGKIAAQINGYELQVTECLFSGILDEMSPSQIAVLFAAIVFEPRKGDDFEKPDAGILGHHKQKARLTIQRLISLEHELNIPESIRPLSLEIAAVSDAWSKGSDFEELFQNTTLDPGDLVRTFRMTIQLLRQLRFALPREYPLHGKLAEATELLNRDVVDARRQLELG